jgi:predicted nucleic acid-binding protein
VLVLDASATVPWCFADEVSEQTEALLDQVRQNGATVPPIWFLEVANVLLIAERSGRLTPAQTATFLNLLNDLPINIAAIEELDQLATILELGRAHNLSSYDASYLHLALRQGLPLATLDGRLSQAARRVGTELVLQS